VNRQCVKLNHGVAESERRRIASAITTHQATELNDGKRATHEYSESNQHPLTLEGEAGPDQIPAATMGNQ
jgi:uncharacterized protein YueI